jgi:hypothetical protein
MARAKHDISILQMALVGYQAEKEKIEDKIRELQAQVNGKKAPAAAAGARKVRAKRHMSAAARARIAAAQKKRWAEFHKRKTAAGKAGA